MSSSRRSARILKKNKPSTSSCTPRTDRQTDSGPIDKYLIASNSSKRKQCWLTPPDNNDEEPMFEQQQSSKRRQQYHIQNQWKPITDCETLISTRTLVPSPVPPTDKVPCQQAMIASGASCYSFRNIFTCQSSRCPLPQLKWADSQDVWNVMKAKDRKYLRDKQLIDRHPQLQSRMRAILLDWIIEVCEVYRLHRETFYLATDFIDRYMSRRDNIQKYQLQLIGVTALFIAAKLEEIYPPKIGEFAYVTDGACTEDDITKQELIMLKTLKWDLCPMTVNTWITVYLNTLNYCPAETTRGEEATNLTNINYSRHSFLSIAKLMDLVMLDEGCLTYSYGILAASVLYHFGSESTTQKATGYTWTEIESCCNWMAPFAITIRDVSDEPKIKEFDNVMPEDHHNIQTHDVTIDTLDQAKRRQRQMVQSNSRSSPDISEQVPQVLTPPPTKHKHSAADSITGSKQSSTHSDHGQPTDDSSNDSTSSTLSATSSIECVSSADNATSSADSATSSADSVVSSQSSLENLHI